MRKAIVLLIIAVLALSAFATADEITETKNQGASSSCSSGNDIKKEYGGWTANIWNTVAQMQCKLNTLSDKVDRLIKLKTGPKGDTGKTGPAGANGKSVVSESKTIEPGSVCVTGGVKTKFYLDANNNGKYDWKIDTVKLSEAVVCNGLKGNTGATGPQGKRGFNGTKGDTGAQGEQGLTGAQGVKGDTGEQGIQGLTGEQGPQGEKGDKGDKGDQGEQGIQGIQGETGIAGQDGADGQDGAQGPKGDTGNDGKDGTSVTIMGTLDNPSELPTECTNGDGYLIDGDLWICADDVFTNVGEIQGPQGEQGIQGEKGDKGDTGAQGADGQQGIQGIQGEKGDKGDKGDTGDAGAQGIQGEIGPQGIQGAQGDQGIQGLKGDKGDKGDTGDTGATGEQGIQGIKGDAGDVGPQGMPGIDGATGPQGIQGEVGATGATGPAGIAGLERIVVTSANDVSSPKTVVVTCSAGKKALGGGVLSSEVAGTITNTANYPSSDNEWTVTAYRSSGAFVDWTLSGYILCADLSEEI